MSKYTSLSMKVSEELKEEIKQYFNDYKKQYNKDDTYTLSKHLKSGIVFLMKQYYKKHNMNN